MISLLKKHNDDIQKREKNRPRCYGSLHDRRFRLLLKTLIIFSIIFSASCVKKKETIFRIPVENLPLGYDLSISMDYNTQLVLTNIHDVLVEESDVTHINELTEHRYMPESNHLILKLKENIRFSDGSIVTSDDVKNSYQWMLTQPHSPLYNYISIDSIIVRPNNYIDIYSSEGWSDIQILISTVGIFKSEHIKKGSEFLNNNHVTTGFYYVFSKNDEKVVLKKNKYHRDYAKFRNCPDIIELILESDLDLHCQLLLDGKVDFIQSIQLENYSAVFSNPTFTTIDRETVFITYMMLNTARKGKNPLQDRRVRFAIASAIDTKTFIEEIVFNKAYPLVIPALRGSFGYPIEKECYDYNIENSKELLKEAGYPNGFRIVLWVYESKFLDYLATYIKESLSQINIEVIIENKALEEHSEPFEDEVPDAYLVTSGGGDTHSIWEAIHNFFYMTTETTGLWNKFENQHKTINDLLDEIEKSSELDENIMDLYKTLTDLIYEEAIVIPFMNPLSLRVINNKFTFERSVPFKFTDFKIEQ